MEHGDRPNQIQLIAFTVTIAGVFIAGLGKSKGKEKEMMIETECTASVN
jgi:hypothetical protein